MLIPLVAVAAATTLLPVTLSRGWERCGRVVVRHRWVAGVAGLAIILAPRSVVGDEHRPAQHVRLLHDDAGGPRAAGARAYTALNPVVSAFRRGDDAFVSVIATHEGDTAAGKALIGALRTRLAELPGGAREAAVVGTACSRISPTPLLEPPSRRAG